MRGTRWVRVVGGLLLTAVVVALAGCTGDGHFTLFGYTTVPNYDMGIRTVYVPIFKNVTSPYSRASPCRYSGPCLRNRSSA